VSDGQERVYDNFHQSRFGGNYVAECTMCGQVCAYWDADDLIDGELYHYCEGA
jgi:hypothetical protein